tara:strand:+ start:235 stop:522 length:288 start_codon:yes stop_codon:yes gene_type:complete
MKLQNKITKQKIEKYYSLTSKALKIAKKAVVRSKQKQAKEIFLMVESYLSDSQYFKKKGNYINAYGALNYAHGWLDSGARLKIFKVKDNRLFTVD